MRPRAAWPQQTPSTILGAVAEPIRVGRFELVREIGRGGMGQVFLARDTKLGRKVAIKFLLDSEEDETFVQQFLVEARATARCTHENIVTIHEVGEHLGQPYMVLEYLDGKTLSEVLVTKPSVNQVVELLIPVACALERAHEHGIVHRDLKPGNIVVTDRGQVKVLDFGIARLVDRSTAAPAAARATTYGDAMIGGLTATGNGLVGTLPFMSPEQWGMDRIDHLSDIWALGIIFWKALTGEHPVGEISIDRLAEALADLDTPLPSIATRAPTLPRGLVPIIDRCLAKRKADRYQNATELIRDLQQFLAPHRSRAQLDDSPYRGLAAFGEDDAHCFFGRSSEIRTALAQLDHWPLLAVIGPSGAGKSSFVHAGLVPAIRAAVSCQVHDVRPGRAPLQRLAHVLAQVVPTGHRVEDFATQLVESPGLFGSMLRAEATRTNQQLIVVVDQLEELFTLCDDGDTRELFLAALLSAADEPSAPVRVVLSMRADFLDRLAVHRRFLSDLTRGLFFLSPPDRENLRETLERPAELAGYSFESRQIVDDMMQAATSRGALPLLSFAAMRLWEARDRQRKLLTVAAYQEMGGVGGAFARHADQVVAAVPPQSQLLLRTIVTRLVTPEGTRAIVDHQELLSLSADRPEVERILDQLVAARLIHLHTDHERVATVEIVHETLIHEWPTLRRWLDDSHALRGFLYELQHAARRWVARNRPSDLVWREATAREALATLRRHLVELSAVEAEFVAAIEAGVRRSRRRKVIAIAAILGVLVLVLAGASVALVKISLAEREAQAKASEAIDALAEVHAARKDLQIQLDVIAEKERARDRAEQRRLAEETKRLAVERDLATASKSEERTKQQLETANTELQRRIAEVQAAKDKAQQAEIAARKASNEAMAASAKTEQLLLKERAARQKAESQLRQIDQRRLE